MELRVVVHALLEYTPKLADVDRAREREPKLADVVAPKVVSVKASPIMTNAATAVVIESFRFAMIFPHTQIACVVSLNKCYFVLEIIVYLNNVDTINALNMPIGFLGGLPGPSSLW
jgi:hypothetical protein